MAPQRPKYYPAPSAPPSPNALEKACVVCFESVSRRQGLACRRGHFVCAACLDAHILSRCRHANSAAAPCPIPDCGQFYDDDALDDVLPRQTNTIRSVNTRLVAFESNSAGSRVGRGIANAAPHAESGHGGGRRAVEAHETQSQTQLSEILRLAQSRGERLRQCPRCPNVVVWAGCSDLSAHGRNRCNNCGFYSANARDWREWNGQRQTGRNPRPAAAQVPANERQPLLALGNSRPRRRIAIILASLLVAMNLAAFGMSAYNTQRSSLVGPRGPPGPPGPQGAPGPPGPPGSKGGCFPASATVLVHGRGYVHFNDLSIGDLVLASPGVYSPIVMFTHQDPGHIGPMVLITAADPNGEITRIMLTANHYVVDGHTAGHLRLAASVVPGHALVSESGAALIVQHVENIEVAQGLYNAHTASGHIVVDGVVASVYTNAAQPWISHAATRILRWWPGSLEWVANVSAWEGPFERLMRSSLFLPGAFVADPGGLRT